MKNNSSTLIRLYYVGKVIGLCPYDLDEVNMPKYSCYGVVYGMILSMVYTFLSYNVILERFELIYPYQFPLKIIADIVFLFVAFLATIASWMVFAFGQTQFRTLVASFNDIDDRMEELGILEDKRRLIKRFVRDVTVVNVSFYVLVTGEQVFLLRNPTYNIKVWLPFTAFKTVVYMTLVIFINLLLVLRDRFRALNERILILERVTIVGAKSWMHSYCVRSDMGVERIRNSPFGTKLKMVNRLHGELCDLTERVCEFFSPAMLVIALQKFMFFLVYVHEIVLFLRNINDGKEESYIISFMLALLIIVEVVNYGYFTNVCETTSNEANGTGSVLHKMWIMYRSNQRVKMVYVLSCQLLQRRLRVTIFGFIDINFSLFRKMITTITTYLVIMLQLEHH